jgi:hypothetical protein
VPSDEKKKLNRVYKTPSLRFSACDKQPLTQWHGTRSLNNYNYSVVECYIVRRSKFEKQILLFSWEAYEQRCEIISPTGRQPACVSLSFWKLGEEQVSLVFPPLFGGNPAMSWMGPLEGRTVKHKAFSDKCLAEGGLLGDDADDELAQCER